MNENQLRYFIASAEALSFTKAAEQYYISQTAVTQQIRALEESFGCLLFDRGTRPVTLTPAGRTFLIEAKAIVERMSRAKERVHEASSGLAGTLKIGYVIGYEKSPLPSVMRQFHHRHSAILTTFFRGYSDVLAAGLLNDEYDILYTWDSSDLRSNDSVEYKLIETARLMAVLHPGHPFAQRNEITRSELKGENLIFASQSSQKDTFGDSFFLNLYKDAGYKPNIIARCSDIESALMMVASEQGITILPEYCISMLDPAENLISIPLVGDFENEEIIAAWKKDNSNPALKLLLDEAIL